MRIIPLSCMDGQATFYNKEHQPNVLNKGEAIMLPVGCLYYFENSGDVPLALLRVSALKGNKPEVSRVWTRKVTREPKWKISILQWMVNPSGQFWELS